MLRLQLELRLIATSVVRVEVGLRLITTSVFGPEVECYVLKGKYNTTTV